MKVLVLLLSFLSVPLVSSAQGYPDKPLKIVVPYAASGTPDLLARLLAKKMSVSMGQPVVVDNKPGASGAISAQAVMAAPADGYTIWIADNGQLAINPALQKSMAYDPLKDFIPVTQLVSQPFYIYAQTALGVQSMRDLIRVAKAKPGELNYGSVGNGSPHHLCMAMVANLADIQLTHIPFKTAAQLIPAMISNEVSLTCTSPVSAAPMVTMKKATPLAIVSEQRFGGMKTIPTFKEATGLEVLKVGASIGVLVKAGTPPAVVAWLASEIRSALRSKDIVARLDELGMEVVDGGPAAYKEQIADEQLRYGRMVRASGATVD